MHICQIQLKGKRPSNPAYPEELNTLGDHLRKVRLDRGLSQPDVARILKVSTDMVTCWELNRNQPTAKFAKAIIDFIGYIPFEVEDFTIGKQLYYARLLTGKTQKQVAELIGSDASNLRYIELGQRVPREKTREKIEEYIRSSAH
ncbi:MAG: helix-turn-helix domain-containing protein [Saprospiraceae bacterium]